MPELVCGRRPSGEEATGTEGAALRSKSTGERFLRLCLSEVRVKVSRSRSIYQVVSFLSATI
jgi:hypothetical protein